MTRSTLWKTEKKIGKRIKMLREEKKMSQRSFASFGIKQAYLASIEAGNIASPSPEMLTNIARGLGLSIEELVEGTDLAGSPYSKGGTPRKAFCPNNDCPKLVPNRLATGMIIPYRFSIDRFQVSRETTYEAKHCPYCGAELLTECPKCKKPILIADPLQTHCLHCGKGIFKPITEEDMKAKGFK